jgi:hypothetical protein
MITTLKVNVVAYIFPPERTCHRLRAGSGFGYIAKFSTGVAFKGRFSSVMTVEEPDSLGLKLGGTTMLSSLMRRELFYC